MDINFDLKRVMEFWDNSGWIEGIPKHYWGVHPVIDAYIYATITPHMNDMHQWLAQTILKNKPCERAISIGSGIGMGDCPSIQAGVCHYLDGFDISPVSVNLARARAEGAGLGDRVSYWVGDANTFVLKENSYDLALSFGGIHHIENLEHLCEQLRRALKPDSYIFMNEFVGPSRFQWTEEQLDILNRVVSIFPDFWRRVDQFERPSLESIIEADPSESVRSEEIIPILSANFELVDYSDYGGGLLMPLWANALIPDIFLRDTRIDKQVIVKLLILLDELLAEHSIAPSNYAQLVFRNRPPSSEQTLPKRISAHSTDRQRWVDMWLSDPKMKNLPKMSNTPTRWWELPAKAGGVLWHYGGAALVEEIKDYVHWLNRNKA